MLYLLTLCLLNFGIKTLLFLYVIIVWNCTFAIVGSFNEYSIYVRLVFGLTNYSIYIRLRIIANSLKLYKCTLLCNNKNIIPLLLIRSYILRVMCDINFVWRQSNWFLRGNLGRSDRWGLQHYKLGLLDLARCILHPSHLDDVS